MSLTQEQIEKISLILSRIRLGSQKMGDSINSVLNYINILNEVDTT
jgi:Asp-tRNA(Asn)/Glu-tRNA(Gln) amidotransferase C subunit